MGESGKWHFIFLGSKITADGDCSNEIKRWLILGRKAMTNLDSILKSRDISFLTKVRVVKAMVFPVVMYGYESWLSAKELMLLNHGAAEHPFESPLNSKEIKPVNPRGNQSWIFTGRTDAEAPILWPPEQRADSLEKTLMRGKIEGRRRRGRQRMRWLEGIINTMDMRLSQIWATVKAREAWCVAVHGVAKSRTLLNNWTTTRWTWSCLLYPLSMGLTPKPPGI